MNQEDYPTSDLEPLLSKDNNTEDDILQLPELFTEEQINARSKTLLTPELENLSITPTS